MYILLFFLENNLFKKYFVKKTFYIQYYFLQLRFFIYLFSLQQLFNKMEKNYKT